MKSFLGGLTLATVMALLNGATTPPPSACILFPRLDERAIAGIPEDACRIACSRSNRTFSERATSPDLD
jgi:hypothetical protein